MSGLPDEEKVESALNFLAESDRRFALLYAAKDSHKEKLKLLRAKVFLESTGTVAEREAHANSHPSVEAEIEAGENVLVEYKLLDEQRHRAETTIEVWRTLEASRRRA